jgi:2,5-diamino-6-(ribosylamino)-4(3H)-pyrimidinone 5'-phosphate reductase
LARPFVVINVAATLDGKIDSVERQGASISSDADRQRVDVLRASVDGIMVGGRTLLGDDPRLLVRSAELRARRKSDGLPENPAKIGIVSRPAFRSEARFLSTGPARIIVCIPIGVPETELAGLRARGVEVHAMGSPRVDLVAAMSLLGELGLRRVLVEGGGSLNFELLRLGLVDEVQVFLAPIILGGASAPSLADGAGLSRDLAVVLNRTGVSLEDDGGLVLRYRVEHRPATPGASDA